MAADLGSAADELAKVEHFMGVTQVRARIGQAIAWTPARMDSRTHRFDPHMPSSPPVCV